MCLLGHVFTTTPAGRDLMKAEKGGQQGAGKGGRIKLGRERKRLDRYGLPENFKKVI